MLLSELLKGIDTKSNFNDTELPILPIIPQSFARAAFSCASRARISTVTLPPRRL